MTALIYVGRFPEGVPPGEYRPTEVDAKKKAADFLLTGVSGSKMEIRWKCGRCERVTDRKLAKLQALHTWTTDF